MCHPLNWFVGWSMVLAAFLTGAAIGTRFHQSYFLGGYDSFSRRVIRLGHVALAALGMLNILFALSPLSTNAVTQAASVCFVAGGVLMPAICFLTGWRERFRSLFFLPVIALVLAVVLTLIGGRL